MEPSVPTKGPTAEQLTAIKARGCPCRNKQVCQSLLAPGCAASGYWQCTIRLQNELRLSQLRCTIAIQFHGMHSTARLGRDCALAGRHCECSYA